MQADRRRTLMCHRVMGGAWCAVAFAVSMAAAQGKHPITHEDVWLMKRVGPPVPSPDGRLIVFTLTEPAYDDSAKVDDLWLVPADGSGPARRLTTARGRESEPAWSPDGTRLAFTAKREGDDVGQVYVLELAGGEARRVTQLSGGASNPRWRPDGRGLLVNTAVHHGATDEASNAKLGAERKARKYNVRAYEGGGPIRYWDRWLDETRPQLAVVDPAGGTPARLLLANTKLASEPGFGGRFTDEREVLDAVWTPDGSAVVFAATTRRNQAATEIVRSDLFIVPAAGGEPRALTRGHDSYGAPAFSPDGRWLAAVVNLEAPRLYTHDRLVVWPWPALEPRAGGTAPRERALASRTVTPRGASL